VVAFHTAVWVVAVRAFPFPVPMRAVVAQYLSSLALVIISGNLVLATRMRPLERAFGGLDKMFASHRIDGVVAALALVAHSVVVRVTTPIFPGRALGIAAAVLLEVSVVLAVAPRAPWRRLLDVPYQTWKAEHRFMGIIVAAGVLHSLLVPTLVRAMPLVAGWVYASTTLGLAAYLYRETWFRVWARRHRYRVVRATPLSDATLEVCLSAEHAPIAPRPGQFAFVRFDGALKCEYHPFTVSAPVADDGALRFSVKASGDYTQALRRHLEAGSTARLEGPYGCFDPTRGRARQLWIAGGIGITPFLALLPGVAADHDVRLVWSVRHLEDAMYSEEIARDIAGRPSISATLWATADRGHLRLAELGIERPLELSVYLCGPVPMREALVAQARELGVRDADIHYEEFSLR
jgi:predicted ferric reductase